MSPPSTRLFHVDTFTDHAFAGNPAAVCPLIKPAQEAWMSSVASEMNLSETAFTWPEPQPLGGRESSWRLRWFTPLVETDLCGHATLAAAHVLWESGLAPLGTPIKFETRSGSLWARFSGERIALDFPAQPPKACAIPAGLRAALDVEPIACASNGTDLLVEVGSEREVRALVPDFAKLQALEVRGVAVTARGEPPFDIVSRFFAPRLGVPEDPVTGSAHCMLGPYWSEKLGKRSLTALQASSRGGVIMLEMLGERVRLEGRAITVMRGELLS